MDTKKNGGANGLVSRFFNLAAARYHRASTQKFVIAQYVSRVRWNFFTNIQWISKGSKPWKNGQHYFGGFLKLAY